MDYDNGNNFTTMEPIFLIDMFLGVPFCSKSPLLCYKTNDLWGNCYGLPIDYVRQTIFRAWAQY